jgi:hypothetical protein
VAAHVSTLQLAWRVRDRVFPESQTYREYLDFVVDGDSLRDQIAELSEQHGQNLGSIVPEGALEPAYESTFDCIGCLGWLPSDEEVKQRSRLLLEEPPDLDTGRYQLYVCPECGDIGCGAVTAVIKAKGEYISWNNLRYENDWDDEMTEEYGDLGPFSFAKDQYRQALLNAPPKEPS